MKKKGFTLIELLAVIVILAIIALIAVPVIMNIISSARENAFKDTMYGIVKAGELYYAEELLTEDGMTEDITFTFTEDGVSPSGLNIKGSLPTSGSMTVTKEGKIILNATDGVHTATKEEDNEEIKVVKKEEIGETPEAPIEKTLSELAKTNDFATSIDACATSGTCAVGTKFALEVAPGNIQNFYVISDTDNTVTLLMDRNIDETTVTWSTTSDNMNGPDAALNYLESQTTGWTNIVAKDFTLTDSVYGTITRQNVRTRMLTETEAEKIVYTYDWSYANLTAPTYGYWTSSAYGEFASGVDDVGGISTYAVYDDVGNGVRPVIELSK